MGKNCALQQIVAASRLKRWVDFLQQGERVNVVAVFADAKAAK